MAAMVTVFGAGEARTSRGGHFITRDGQYLVVDLDVIGDVEESAGNETTNELEVELGSNLRHGDWYAIREGG